MTDIIDRQFIEYFGGRRSVRNQALIVEEPLSIRVSGKAYSVVMRTPGDETAHVAGFCLSEGILDHPGDIVTLGFCEENETNVATLTLTDQRRGQVAELLERKGFISQTSCGICGKEVVRDMQQMLPSVPRETAFRVDHVMACINSLPTRQPIYEKTRSAHAAMIFDQNRQPMASAEDVGRHNALDKAIGKVFMNGDLHEACFAVMSSRLSYELVQKAARAGLEMLVGISRPTALAADLARSVNMTLACAKDDRFMVFCGDERITQADDGI
ncbi:MAG: formate dehydrogenase accessory sulfurtransferase FdhD [Desulfobacterales bacterium]|nr:formate dehydrogenase accessory sulfurtransferase FdhD [Desulfobacterales bacterium]MBS3755694.1 formate dehydrogenase accessory sulfurtransferase FdhD [Desulfobacterales bacterium]